MIMKDAKTCTSIVICKTKYRYYQNGINVTLAVLNGWKLPCSERFFEVVCK